MKYYVSTSRRHFLKAAGGLTLAWLTSPPPYQPDMPRRQPTPEGERPIYFVPRENYHELPPHCYQPNLIRPHEIILHWDGNRHGRELWVTAITYQTLKYLGFSAHFAVDHKRVWQMLPMYTRRVQQSNGARGFNLIAINIEMAGTDFDAADNFPPENEIVQTIRLVSQLMDFYGLAFENVVGHCERDPAGKKPDPGVKFLEHFRERLRAYRTALAPLKHLQLADF